MKKRIVSLITVLLLITMLLPTAFAGAVYDIKVEGTAMYSYAKEAVAFLNEAREKAGVAPLQMDEHMLQGAMQRAAELSVYYSHTRPDGSECFTAIDWEWNVGENIAIGFLTAEDVTNAWIDSPGHYSNMINNYYRRVGIGCFKDKSGRLSWVQLFDSGTPVAPTDYSNKVKTFDVKISEEIADLVDYPVVKGKFADVLPSKWYFEHVEYATDNGLFNGLTDTSFGPDNEMTRAMFVTVLYRISGESVGDTDGIAFADVESGRYYTDAVAWASKNGVVNGITPTAFKPQSYITRQQMCVMLVRYAEYKDIELQVLSPKVEFADDAFIGDYAKEAVYDCQRAEIISGVGENRFAPTKTANRAQVAKIFSLFHKNYIAK